MNHWAHYQLTGNSVFTKKGLFAHDGELSLV